MIPTPKYVINLVLKLRAEKVPVRKVAADLGVSTRTVVRATKGVDLFPLSENGAALGMFIAGAYSLTKRDIIKPLRPIQFGDRS